MVNSSAWGQLGGLTPDCSVCGAKGDSPCVNVSPGADNGKPIKRPHRGRMPGTKPNNHRDSHFRQAYGIGLADYNRMLAEQGRRCRLCGNFPEPGSVLVVDHCHVTGRVRGLLCDHCNYWVLGCVVQDSRGLEHALKRLEMLRNYIVAPYVSSDGL